MNYEIGKSVKLEEHIEWHVNTGYADIEEVDFRDRN